MTAKKIWNCRDLQQKVHLILMMCKSYCCEMHTCLSTEETKQGRTSASNRFKLLSTESSLTVEAVCC